MKHVSASDGHRIAYDTWGSNRDNPVVLLQGLGMDSRGYGLQRYTLSRDHYVIAIDHRGSQSAPADKPFSMYRLARDVLRVMENEQINSAHLVGTSMGAIVAQIVSVMYPKHVRTLTLISSSCHHHKWRTDLLQEWKHRLIERNSAVIDHEILSWLIGPRLLHRSRIFLPIAQQLFQDINVEQFCMQIDAICSFSDSFAERITSISVPTHVIVGSQDMLTPVGDSQELCMFIPDSKLSIIYGAAHGVIIESPRDVGNLMLQGMSNTYIGDNQPAAK